jgi:bla regulator protein blaR1
MAADAGLVFLRVCAMASVAAGLVLLLRAPARRWFGAHMAYRLWAAVPLAAGGALMPVDFGAGSSGPLAAAAGTLHAWLAAEGHGRALALVWLAGMIGSATLALIRQWCFLRAERRGRAGPGAIGVITPRLVTPADFACRYTPAERRLIRAHERAHIDRLDGRALVAAALAQWLFWFNPLAHLALRAFRLDQELACDATVMERLPGERRRYAEALLHAEPSRAVPMVAAWRTEGSLDTRIAMLSRPSPSVDRVELGLQFLLALWLAAFLVAWVNEPAWLAYQPYLLQEDGSSAARALGAPP